MKATIRDVRNSELDETARLMVECYRQYADQIPEHLWKEYAEEIADVKRRLPFSDLIVAERNGRIIGAVTYYADATMSEHEGWPEGFAEIRLLAVDPNARGFGLGRLLTEECINRARNEGIRTIGLHTSKLMEVARDMYERMGFQRAPEFDFTPDPDVDIVATAYTLTI
jgi:ribosomal protein S18 acetylase RimI-like enzyme